MLPKMISSISGSPIANTGPARSRRNNCSSVSVSRASIEPRSEAGGTGPGGTGAGGTGAVAVLPDMTCAPPADRLAVGAGFGGSRLRGTRVDDVVAGQRDEGVLQAGLFHPQVLGDDVA